MKLAILDGVSKYYRTSDIETRALNEISLRINEGDLIAVTGKSGSGKSTLLNVLGTVEQPTRGSYFIYDSDVSSCSDAKRCSLRRELFGFIFQSFNLIEHLTVSENVELPLKYKKIARDERKQIVGEWLKRLGIEARSRHYPSELSGGQQQRVAIARALVGRPKLLLADEPTGNLDEENSKSIISILERINADYGTAVVLVTHDAEQARRCNRVITLVDGAISNEQAGRDG